jgi:NADPH:quinone reductase-like Zn-dependent oxidoreductase
MAFLTAYGALFEVAAVRAGEPVVITAASSSVGLAAIQLVNAAGAVPIAVTRSNRKRNDLLAAGAVEVISADQGDVAESIRKIAGPAGARVLLDAVGGKLVPCLVSGAAVGGIIVNYGALDARTTDLPPAALLAKSLTLRGYLVHEIVRSPTSLARAQKFILERLGSGELSPTIARTFPLEEISAAYRFLESNEQFGKVVVSL